VRNNIQTIKKEIQFNAAWSNLSNYNTNSNVYLLAADDCGTAAAAGDEDAVGFCVFPDKNNFICGCSYSTECLLLNHFVRTMGYSFSPHWQMLKKWKATAHINIL